MAKAMKKYTSEAKGQVPSAKGKKATFSGGKKTTK